MRIIFLGTPDIARQVLSAILANGFKVDLVLTQPDRPAGRGKKIIASPVKQLALDENLTIIQPESLKNNPQIIEQIKSIKPDIMIVIAYGMILPKIILDIPTLGCINIHVSLLPAWRGAAPIQRAIIAGDQVTGVTIMKMDEGLDTGNILIQKSVKIDDKDTTLSLTNRLTSLSCQLIIEYLNNYTQIRAKPQTELNVSYASKIEKAEAKINWNEDASLISRKIRGFNPSPGSFSTIDNQLIKIWQAETIELPITLFPGEIFIDNKNFYVGCGNKTLLNIKELQLAGKNRQTVIEYINGCPKIKNKKFI